MTKALEIPPCPDPGRYILVKTKEGIFWRRKRGTAGPARLNEKYEASARGMAVTAPAAKRIVDALRPHLEGARTGRLTVGLSGRLRKQYNASGRVDYKYLEGFDFQQDQDWPYETEIKSSGGRFEVKICSARAPGENNSQLSDSFFELILVSGDCTTGSPLRVDHQVREVSRDQKTKSLRCMLDMDIPPGPWFAILKYGAESGGAGSIRLRVIAVG